MRLGITLAVLSMWVISPALYAQPFGIGMILNPEGSRLFPQSILFPRHPGKPDPRWREFKWNFIEEKYDNTRYRLYLYELEEWSARFAIPQINSGIAELEKLFSYTPTHPFSYLLFTSRREFHQANIFDISEGVQGITSTQEATMAIPFWGEKQSFDHISTHELTHQFQVQKINDLSGMSGTAQATGLPLWFIEGMAEYYSLHGVDAESRMYLRDILINPDPENDYVIPHFFDEGTAQFISTYKVGQAKIDFLETQFGKGTSQTILNQVASAVSLQEPRFKELVAEQLKIPAEEIEEKWLSYLEQYKSEAQLYKQPIQDGKHIADIQHDSEDVIDYFDISPKADFLVVRLIDKLSHIASLKLIDLKSPHKTYTLIEDNQPNALSLFFFQSQTLTVTNDSVAYVVDTASGPEIEARHIQRLKNGRVSIGNPLRIKLNHLNILEASSLAISPDGQHTALVAIGPEGSQNIWILDGYPSHTKYEARKINHEHYSWKNLSWDTQGILAAGDRTANGQYALFRIDPKQGSFLKLTSPHSNQFFPSSTADGILFQSWQSGSSQAHLLTGQTEQQITSVPTGIFYPRLRGNDIYCLVFEKGRYQLSRFPIRTWSEWSNPNTQAIEIEEEPWKPQLAEISPESIHPYQPFISPGSSRLDSVGAFFSTGGFLGISAMMSDLMRESIININFLMLGKLDRTSASAFLTNRKGRTKWTLGAYREIFPRLDNIFPRTSPVRTYLHREAGILGSIKYPFDPFSFLDVELRIASVNRGNFSDPPLYPSWQALNPGSELLLAPTLRLGYDRLIYETFSGPLKGFAALFEIDSSFYPRRSAISHRVRADISNYWHLPGRTVLQLQGIGATTWGDRYRNTFFVSSDDILRAYPFNDERLYSDSLLAWKSELRFPIGSLFSFPYLRGLIAYDLGTNFSKLREFNSNVSSSVTGGLTFNIPPISMNLMLSHPLREAPGPQDHSIWHFTLRYLYL